MLYDGANSVEVLLPKFSPPHEISLSKQLNDTCEFPRNWCRNSEGVEVPPGGEITKRPRTSNIDQLVYQVVVQVSPAAVQVLPPSLARSRTSHHQSWLLAVARRRARAAWGVFRWVRQAIAGLKWPPVGLPLQPSGGDEAWQASSPPDGHAARQPPGVLSAGEGRSFGPLRPSVNAQARP